MSYLSESKQVVRKPFGKLKDLVPVPNLIEVQSKSFNDFVQLDYLPSERLPIGLEKVLRDIFPIDYEGKVSLEYVSYELGDWACTCAKLTGLANRYSWVDSVSGKTGCSRITPDMPSSIRYKTCAQCLTRVHLKLPMTVDECRISEQTFSLPLRVKVQLTSWDVAEDGARAVRDIKEQDIFFADIPVMTDLYEEDGKLWLGNQGTFVINGIDRVVVSQMHRSPGVVFSKSKKVNDLRGRPYYLARIIPMRGSWIDFEFDSNDSLYVRVDKKKKIFATTFLQALGYKRDEILSLFYESDLVYYEKGEFYKKVNDSLLGQRVEIGMLAPEHEAKFVGRRITKDLLSKLADEGITKMLLKKSGLIGKVFARDVVNPKTGEIIDN